MRDIKVLEAFGLQPLGLCSSLWISASGDFRAGVFQDNDSICLVVLLGLNKYYICCLSLESINQCLLSNSTLYQLASAGKNPYILKEGIRFKSNWLNLLWIRWVVHWGNATLIPNAYYIWSHRCLCIKGCL